VSSISASVPSGVQRAFGMNRVMSAKTMSRAWSVRAWDALPAMDTSVGLGV
jgi:hypothetical protein